MDRRKLANEGYGNGFVDGWRSVAGSRPMPPQIGVIPNHLVPVDMTFYEFGYQRGCEEAQRMRTFPRCELLFVQASVT